MKFYSYKDGERMYYNFKVGGFVKKDWDCGYYSLERRNVEVGLLHKLTVSIYLFGQEIILDFLDDNTGFKVRNTYMSFININDPKHRKYKVSIKNGQEDFNDCNKEVKIKPRFLQKIKAFIFEGLKIPVVVITMSLVVLTLPIIRIFEKCPKSSMDKVNGNDYTDFK